ncbi:hypothetical protein ACQPUY_14010 [Clostridium nigeriense]|uniref:hypothetical protein n=1 Tax=Clostridium nigeriense TaxID=1805470 RepID=UPI003D35720F
MKFNNENMRKYNLIESKDLLKCSVCNEETNYVDFWSNNKFCSTECKDKYYSWIKNNKDNVNAY